MIPNTASLAVFVVAALALLLVPGPAVLYVVARSIHQGRRAGLASVLGIHVGTLVHISAATAGLSALLVSSSALGSRRGSRSATTTHARSGPTGS